MRILLIILALAVAACDPAPRPAHPANGPHRETPPGGGGQEQTP